MALRPSLLLALGLASSGAATRREWRQGQGADGLLGAATSGSRAAAVTSDRAPFEEAFKDSAAVKQFKEALSKLNSTNQNGQCSLEGSMAGFGCAYPSAQAPACKCPHEGQNILLCNQPKMEEVDKLVSDGKMDKAFLAWKSATAGRCTFVPWIVAAHRTLGLRDEEEASAWESENDPFDGPLRYNPAVVKFRQDLKAIPSTSADGKCNLNGEMGGFGCAVRVQDQPACSCPYGMALSCNHPSRSEVTDLLNKGDFDKAFEMWKVATAGRCEVSQWGWIGAAATFVFLSMCCICCICSGGSGEDKRGR